LCLAALQHINNGYWTSTSAYPVAPNIGAFWCKIYRIAGMDFIEMMCSSLWREEEQTYSTLFDLTSRRCVIF